MRVAVRRTRRGRRTRCDATLTATQQRTFEGRPRYALAETIRPRMARWLGRLAADPVVISIEVVFVRANYLDSSGVVGTVATAAGAVVIADDLQARDVRGVALLGSAPPTRSRPFGRT